MGFWDLFKSGNGGTRKGNSISRAAPCPKWHGVSIDELNRLAKTVYHGVAAYVDESGFLVFSYTSHRQKTTNRVQCAVDQYGKLNRIRRSYYPGQIRDSADDFIELVNQKYSFSQYR